ncbi:hypothetical protein [Cellulomonas composti]|nr:hypothetical protein [Cellulomonas composti]
MASTRTIRGWFAADAVLVATFVVLLAARVLSGGGGAAPEGVPSVAGPLAPSSTAGATAPSTKPISFRLPSGNIACIMARSGVTCTIASITYAEPVVAGCAGETGHVLVLNKRGFEFDCVNGPGPAVAGDDVAVLEYGSAATIGRYTCTSATDGVTCTSKDGVGFQLARAAWRELP